MLKHRVLVIIKFIAFFAVLFIAIQFLPVWLLQTNPPLRNEPVWDSPQTRAIARRACFDCHSNETVWPLYTRIAPVSWLVTFDVIRGRRHLNFSEWRRAGGTKGEPGISADEVIATIAKGDMPPGSYLKMHPQAKLSAVERQQLMQGLAASLK